MQVFCFDCGYTTALTLDVWRCPSCGGAWEPAALPAFDAANILRQDFSIWRYGSMLGLDIVTPFVPMGVGWTPLVPAMLFGKKIHLKLEYLQPTGSFKDRGINAMVNQLVHMGVSSMIEDSTGNAGASLAAHGAKFGIHTEIYVPEDASRFKQHQISIYGVDLKTVSGTRKDTERAAHAAVGVRGTYASHAYHPAYLSGQMTVAFEVWEQLEGKTPDWILYPVAQGGQFIGAWLGWSKLYEAGLINRLPRMVAVQSAQVSPLYLAWRDGFDVVQAITPTGRTIADGVNISNPVRGKRLLHVVSESRGRVMAIQDHAISEGQRKLAKLGFYVEPTSALVCAALKELIAEIHEDDLVLLPLTGNGLKGEPTFNRV